MTFYKHIVKFTGGIWIIIWLVAILTIQASAEDVIEIKVFEKSEIEEDEIYLGKIAELKGNDRALIDRIGDIVVGASPLPETTKRIHEDTIKICLKKHNMDVSKIDLIVPQNAFVTRKCVEISNKDIEKVVRSFLQKNLPWDRGKVTIDNFRLNMNRVLLPKGDITYEIMPTKGTDYLGTVSLCVILSVDGQAREKVWVTVDISVLSKVVAARRPLGRYKLITEEDIHLVDMNLAKLPSNVIASLEEVLGKRTKRMINSQTVLRSDLLELPPLVKRGSIVSIIAESSSLRVTALGKVEEKGRKGQMIRVENLDSNKSIYARVLDSNTVVVDF